MKRSGQCLTYPGSLCTVQRWVATVTRAGRPSLFARPRRPIMGSKESCRTGVPKVLLCIEVCRGQEIVELLNSHSSDMQGTRSHRIRESGESHQGRLFYGRKHSSNKRFVRHGRPIHDYVAWLFAPFSTADARWLLIDVRFSETSPTIGWCGVDFIDAYAKRWWRVGEPLQLSALLRGHVKCRAHCPYPRLAGICMSDCDARCSDACHATVESCCSPSSP